MSASIFVGLPENVDLARCEITTGLHLEGDLEPEKLTSVPPEFSDDCLVVLLPGWEVHGWDGVQAGDAVMYPDAPSSFEAAREYVETGRYEEEGVEVLVECLCWRIGWARDDDGFWVAVHADGDSHTRVVEPACEAA